MNRREKMLMFGFIGAVVIWQGASVVDSLVFQPVSDRRSRILALELSVGKKKVRERELQIAQVKLKKWSLRSLPPDPLVAATLYQNWLIDLATKCKLTNIEVIPQKRTEAKAKGDTYYTVGAQVKARGTVKSLCEFLYQFHQAGLLHRMSRVAATTAQHEGDPTLELNLFVQALALTDSPPRSTLFTKEAEGADASKVLVPDKPLRSRKEYDAIADRNPFVKGYNGPPRIDPPRPPAGNPTKRPSGTPGESPIDAAEFTYLIATIASDGNQEVWLYDRTTNKQTILTEGTEFAVAELQGRVVLIQDDFVEFLIGEEMWQLPLGKNLREMRKLPNLKKSAKQ